MELSFLKTTYFALTLSFINCFLVCFFPVFRSTEDVNAFNERLKEVLFNEQSGILETWSRQVWKYTEMLGQGVSGPPQKWKLGRAPKGKQSSF